MSKLGKVFSSIQEYTFNISKKEKFSQWGQLFLLFKLVMFQIGAVRSSFSPSVCLGIILEPIDSLVLSKLWDGPRNPYEIMCGWSRLFGKTEFFYSIMVFNFFLHCSLMKIGFIYSAPVQILYLFCSCANPVFGKNTVSDVRAKMPQPIWL